MHWKHERGTNFVETPKYEAKFERNLDPHKSTKHNIRLIKHNRSIIKSRILPLTRNLPLTRK